MTRSFAPVSERSDAPATGEAPVIQVPVDLVDFEARLAGLERRLAGYEARDERLLEVIEAVKKLTEAVAPLVKPAREAPGAPQGRRKAAWPLPSPHQSLPGPVAPERIALAHSRLRETLFTPSPTPVPATAPPPGRDSWLLRTMRRMVKDDPQASGRLLAALLPAHGLARVPPVQALPGPPEGVARVLVAGRLRRRIRWEKARLQCAPKVVYELAPLVRMRASPAQLLAAGVRLDPPLALALVAYAIDPAWTGGHRFAVSHRGPERVTYLSVNDRAVPAVGAERPSIPVSTTICCLDDDLFPLLCGSSPPGVTILGAVAPLELVQRWLARTAGPA